VLATTIVAVPARLLTVRFEFRGALLIQTLGVLPLVMPAFVGAAAMQMLFGRSGSVNLLLKDWFGFTVPLMDGLNGVIFVETLHYFPFILLNLSASLANIDSSMEEAAQNLGARGGGSSARWCSRWRCPATSPAPRSSSSRSSTTSARRWC
jgi:iron(III) transport system permease protein